MKKTILTAMILGTAFLGRVQPAQAGGFGVGVAIGAAAGLVTGAAFTAAACDAPRYYVAPVSYAPVRYVPAYAPAPVVYASPPVVCAPAPVPVVVYPRVVVAVPAPIIGATVVYGRPYYRAAHGPHVVIRARW